MTTTEIEPALNGKSLELEEGLEQDEWLQIGGQLSRVDRGIQWLVGDWINYGLKNFNSAVDLATDVLTHLGPDSIVRYADVSATFEPDRRHTEKLEFSHHVKVMGLARVQQDQLLEEAARLEYTVREIEQRRNEIKTGIKDAASELSGGMSREELQEKRAADKARKIEHARKLHEIAGRVKDGANEVRVPRDVFFSTVLPAFKQPKADPIDV